MIPVRVRRAVPHRRTLLLAAVLTAAPAVAAAQLADAVAASGAIYGNIFVPSYSLGTAFNAQPTIGLRITRVGTTLTNSYTFDGGATYATLNARTAAALTAPTSLGLLFVSEFGDTNAKTATFSNLTLASPSLPGGVVAFDFTGPALDPRLVVAPPRAGISYAVGGGGLTVSQAAGFGNTGFYTFLHAPAVTGDFTATVTLARAGAGGGQYGLIAADPLPQQVIPEPSTYVLLAAGLGFVAFTVRQRTRVVERDA